MSQNVFLRLTAFMIVIGCMCAASPSARAAEAAAVSADEAYRAAQTRFNALKAVSDQAIASADSARAEFDAIDAASWRFAGLGYEDGLLDAEVMRLSTRFPRLSGNLREAGEDRGQILKILNDYRVEAINTGIMRSRLAADAAQATYLASVQVANEGARKTKEWLDANPEIRKLMESLR